MRISILCALVFVLLLNLLCIVTYSYTLEDGSPAPSFITFDSSKATFSLYSTDYGIGGSYTLKIDVSVMDDQSMKNTTFYWNIEVKSNTGPPRFKSGLDHIYVIPLVPK